MKKTTTGTFAKGNNKQAGDFGYAGDVKWSILSLPNTSAPLK